jgi:hypothetical protein
MTASVFLSWSSPDRAGVFALKERLLDVGVTLWEYTDDSPAGGNVHEEILKSVNAVEVAVICLSDKTFDRDWITQEADWCFQALKDPQKPLKHIIPVWIGDHVGNGMPKVLRDNNFVARDLVTPTSVQLTKFIEDLFQHLGRPSPRVIPAALFAMTADQAVVLFKQKAKMKALAALCQATGMRAGTTLLPSLKDRYGGKAGDLAPFAPGQTFLELANTWLREANTIRIEKRRPPVVLKWVQDELVGPGKEQRAREEWQAGGSLLVVDAASTFDPDVYRRLMDLPHPRRPELSALIWLPPYTHHTAPIEHSLEVAAMEANIGHLGDAFCEWRDRRSLRAMTFDTLTCAGAALWLRRALMDVEDTSEPLGSHVASVRSTGSVPFNLGSAMVGTSRG